MDLSVDLPTNTAHKVDIANEIINPNHQAPTHKGELESRPWEIGP